MCQPRFYKKFKLQIYVFRLDNKSQVKSQHRKHTFIEWGTNSQSGRLLSKSPISICIRASSERTFFFPNFKIKLQLLSTFPWHPIQIANIAESSSKSRFTFPNEHQQHCLSHPYHHTHIRNANTNTWLLRRWAYWLINSCLRDPGVWVDMQLIIRTGRGLGSASPAHKPPVETSDHRDTSESFQRHPSLLIWF